MSEPSKKKKPRKKLKYWENEPRKKHIIFWLSIFIPSILCGVYYARETEKSETGVVVCLISLIIAAVVASIVLRCLGYKFKARNEHGHKITRFTT